LQSASTFTSPVAWMISSKLVIPLDDEINNVAFNRRRLSTSSRCTRGWREYSCPLHKRIRRRTRVNCKYERHAEKMTQ
jgi:hypothetical protein